MKEFFSKNKDTISEIIEALLLGLMWVETVKDFKILLIGLAVIFLFGVLRYIWRRKNKNI